MFRILLILSLFSGNGFAKAPTKEYENAAATILIEALYEDQTVEEETDTKELSSRQMSAIKITIKNLSSEELALVWCDFFARVSRGKWVGSWWLPALHVKDRIKQSFSGEEFPAVIPVGGRISCVLLDPWVDNQSIVEYKFACLIKNPQGQVYLSESPAQEAVPLELEKSGVELALSSLSVALKSLFSGNPEKDPPTTLEIGASINHKPLGLVEISKNSLVVEEMRKWQIEEGEISSPSSFYVYQTEVANNTTEPLRLVQLVFSTQHDEKWLSGAIKSPVLVEEDIVASGYLQSVEEGGVPKLKKMEDAWIPPGARAVFPHHWHPKSGDSTPGRHLAILLGARGSVVFAEGETDSSHLPASLPSTHAEPSIRENN